MDRIYIIENKIHMVFEICDDKTVKLLHFSSLEFRDNEINETEKSGFRLVEFSLTGLDKPEERHGMRNTATAPGYRLKYKNHKDYKNGIGRKIEITTFDEETNIHITSHFQFYNGISVVRCYNVLKNLGKKCEGMEFISSFNLNGIEKEGIKPMDDKILIKIPHNSWQREMQWQDYTLEQLGMAQSQPIEKQRSSKIINVSNTGNWSTKEYLPMGYIENTETKTNIFWQIEHNGSWHWEIGDQTSHLYLQLSGPTENQSHWYKNLEPDEEFITVPVAVGVSIENFDNAIGELTKYRRAIRRKNEDNESLGIIFNDYMNCLWANPTSKNEIPLIDAAAKAGCEYFCIDAGWYASGYWWDGVGEWLPSIARFPNGIKEVIDYIRSKKMIPGLWLELEVMGINCEKATNVKEDWFFIRHGKKVYDRSRYQLDFRNPEVIDHANEVIDRLVNEYGIGYIKMDYNIEPGIGTELCADSFGDGLLQHERAYLKWLDQVFEKYPNLIIENCSSGGLRIDYAMLSRHSIQSTSDQEDYVRNATIAANSPTGVTPEQSAVWSYPLQHADKEEVVFNMVNALLLRVHQSGHLAEIDQVGKELVSEALDYYKEIRQYIKISLPFWPLGLSKFSDTWVCLGLKTQKKILIAVWRKKSIKDIVEIPINELNDKKVNVKCAYPIECECSFNWNEYARSLSVKLPKQYSARIFEINF